MPFNIDYGPISTAMGLARQGGQAAGTQLGFQDQMAMQNQLLAQQSEAQKSRAQDISLALEGQRNSATQNLAQAQLGNTAAYQQAMLGQLGPYRQALGQARMQTAGAAQQRADQQGDYQQAQLGIGQQNADTKAQQAQATQAYMQWEQQHGDDIARNGEAGALNQLIHSKLNAGQDVTQEFQQMQTVLAKQNMIGNHPQQAPQSQPAPSAPAQANPDIQAGTALATQLLGKGLPPDQVRAQVLSQFPSLGQ